MGHASDLPIAPGDYKYREYLVKFTSSQRRKLTGTGNISLGEFWNGHRKSFGGTMGWRPKKLNLFAPPSRRGGRADQTNATLP
ncbi:MAG: hypothetical protein DMG13_31200 [Acidobacteria bacterium]|nr:MAG: hypothetical protein DMG13_31200 [Acidobacteriota bacterium]